MCSISLQRHKQGLVWLLLLWIALPYSLKAQVANSINQGTVKVLIVEKGTSLGIPAALLWYQGKAHIANDQGEVILRNVKGNEVTLSVRSLGSKEIKDKKFKIRKDGTVLVVMSPDTQQLQEVTVKGERRRRTEKTQQVAALGRAEIERGASVSVGKLLEKLPGVSVVSSGSTIAKPVIQGMHGSRIVLVKDGVRLESQSWGDDHAPEIDHTSSSIIEVIKGAESIRFGYGAIGGVVLLNQAPLPYGHDNFFISGRAMAGYDTNARGGDANVTLDMGYKSVGLRLHGLVQRSGDYTTPEYRLNNTGVNNISGSATLGWKGDHVTATLQSSFYYSRSGIYYASKTSDINQLLARFEAGRPDPATVRPFSYTIEPPFQQVQHFTLKGDVKWYVNDMHDITFKATYQDNLRQEFENRKDPRWSWLPVQDLQLTSMSADAMWSGRWGLWDMNTQAGATLSYQYNYNVPGTKQPAFIPNYAALTVGYFALHKAQIGKLNASLGMRYDIRAMDVSGYSSLSSYQYYDAFRMFYNFSSSFAAHYQFNDNWEARANIGWAWRPPDVNELYAVGLSHGTHWVVGNEKLEGERGYKAVFGGAYRNTWMSIEGNGFFQKIDNYIYDNIGTGVDRFHNHPSGKYPKFIYTQDNTRFTGGDLVLSVLPLEGLNINAKGEWIFARNLTQDCWLPFMPSDRYTLGASYGRTFGSDDQWKANVELEGLYATKQTRFDPEKDLVPDTPPAYFVMSGSAEIGYRFADRRFVRLMIVGDNILNTMYKEYTDRFRYYAHARGAQFSIRTIVNF